MGVFDVTSTFPLRGIPFPVRNGRISENMAEFLNKTGFNTGAAIDTSNFISRLTGGTFETGANLTFQGGNLIMDGAGRLNVKDIYVNGIKLSQLDNVNYTKGFALANPNLSGTLRATNNTGLALYGTFRFGANGRTFTIDDTGFSTTGSLYVDDIRGPWGEIRNNYFTLNSQIFNFYTSNTRVESDSGNFYLTTTRDFLLLRGRTVSVDASAGDIDFTAATNINLTAAGNMNLNADHVHFYGDTTFHGDTAFLGSTATVDSFEASEVNIPSGGKIAFGNNDTVFRLNGSGSTLNIESNGKVNFKTDLRVDGKKVITEGDTIFTDMEYTVEAASSSPKEFKKNESTIIGYGYPGNKVYDYIKDLFNLSQREGFANSLAYMLRFRGAINWIKAQIPSTGVTGIVGDYENYILSRTTVTSPPNVQLYLPYDGTTTRATWLVKKRIPFVFCKREILDH